MAKYLGERKPDIKYTIQLDAKGAEKWHGKNGFRHRVQEKADKLVQNTSESGNIEVEVVDNHGKFLHVYQYLGSFGS